MALVYVAAHVYESCTNCQLVAIIISAAVMWHLDEAFTTIFSILDTQSLDIQLDKEVGICKEAGQIMS